MKKKIALILGIVLIFSMSLTACDGEAAEISDTTLSAVLEDASDLTTQDLLYTDIIEMSKGKIPLISKDKFLIKYTAKVNAGFDVSDVDLNLSDDTLEIVLPHSEIQDITISRENIKIIDTNFSLIDGGKQATLDALEKAEEHAVAYAKKSELLPTADANAENVMKGLFKPLVGDREIVVKFK